MNEHNIYCNVLSKRYEKSRLVLAPFMFMSYTYKGQNYFYIFKTGWYNLGSIISTLILMLQKSFRKETPVREHYFSHTVFIGFKTQPDIASPIIL